MKKPIVDSRSKIVLEIGLDDKKHPVEITWQAEDQMKEPEACKAMLISLFDAKRKDTLKIDLWTEDFQVHEMDRFMYQSLRALADTYFKATRNQELANDFQRFVHYFGEKTEVIPKAE